MEDRLELNPEKILQKKFEKNVKGYNANEVDEFLDVIIRDYVLFAKYKHSCDGYIATLEGQIAKLDKKNKEIEVENYQMKKRLDGIKSSDNVSKENIGYLQKINKYENFLHAHGFNPKDALK